MRPYLTDRELATVLHALRVVQETQNDREIVAVQRVLGARGCSSCREVGAECDHFTNAPMLTGDEIDQLCDRLNGGDEAPEATPAVSCCCRHCEAEITEAGDNSGWWQAADGSRTCGPKHRPQPHRPMRGTGGY